MLPTLLSRIQHLFEFIYARPIPGQLVAYLGENFCPQGETAAVAVSTLDDNGQLVCEMAYGFLNNENMIGSTSSIFSDRPGSEALIRLRTIILTEDQIDQKYSDFVRQEFMKGYKTAVLMPIGTRKIYGIALQGVYADISGFQEYVECTSSLVGFYESTTLSAYSNLGKAPIANRHLTTRQEHILSLIKQGMTNAAIGNELGYSESLIRQETIIIYRKLGISGRKDLIRKDSISVEQE